MVILSKDLMAILDTLVILRLELLVMVHASNMLLVISMKGVSVL
jgi:hypothetical protein